MKILKKTSLIAIIILMAIINNVWAKGTIQYTSDLFDVFNKTGAKLYETNITCKGLFTNGTMDIKEMKKTNQDIVNALNVDNNTYNMKIINNKNKKTIITKGWDGLGRTINITLYNHKYNNKIRSELSIDIIQGNNLTNISDIERKIKKISKKFNINTQITTCIIGTFKGKLNSIEKFTSLSKSLNIINGEKVEGVLKSNLTSISAYSPNISKHIYTGNNKMNINIAMRYNKYEDKTYIWIGTPIIRKEY
ncbi:YwmB family TATA-box binding protein [Dethiothermospora halolimnae]|uniref:YwmB family TATA-box binding protein n=1 Tax=Dethiothermospora halolimnae TaxID=3114390 RepID=UPI003CCBF708